MTSSLFANAPAGALGGGGGGNYLDALRFKVESRVIEFTEYDAEAKTSVPTEIEPGQFKGMFDLDNIETGWISFKPMSVVMALASEAAPAKPSDGHKYGVRIVVKMPGHEKPYEVLTSSKTMLDAIGAVYDQYLKERAANPGKLPVITVPKWDKVTYEGGKDLPSKSVYKPVFTIASWAARPESFTPNLRGGSAPANPPTPAPSDRAPSTGSTVVAPPKKVLETLDANDFG
jgi:hypothetical protein